MAADQLREQPGGSGSPRRPSRGDAGWVVLLVEDDPDDAWLVQHALEQSGQPLDLRAVGTLREALETVTAVPVDVILGDLGLPDAQGLEVVDQLLEAAPDVPLVVLTGLHDRPDVGVAAVRHGAQDYLVKGEAGPSEVERSLRFAIERQRLTRLVTAGILQREALSRLESRAGEVQTARELMESVSTAATEAVPRTRIQFRVETDAGTSTLGERPSGDDGGGWSTDRWPVAVEEGGGVLLVHCPDARPLSEHERMFFERLAQMLSASLAMVATSAALRLRTGQLRMLYDLSRRLTGCTAVDEVLRLVTDLLLQSAPAPAAGRVELTIHGATASAGELVQADQHRVSTPVVVDGEEVGALVVHTADGRAGDEIGRILLGEVAELVAGWLLRRRAEEDRDERRRWLELLLGQLPAVVWTVDTDLRFTSLAGSGLDVLDPQPEPGQHLTDYFGPDTGFTPTRGHRRALDGVETSYSFWWHDRWWDVVLTPMHDRAGTAIGALGVGVDATEQRRAQERAEREQERYRALFERSMDAIVLTDRDGRMVDVNPAMCELLGWPRDELVSRPTSDLAPDPEQAAEFRRRRQLLQEQGELRGTVPLVRADGTVIEVEFSAATEIVDGTNLSIMRDVTAQAQMQRALAASEQRFRTLAEHAVEGIFRIALTPQRAYEYINPALERLTGYGLDDLIHDDLLLRRRTHRDDALDDLTPGAHTLRFQRADGQWRWLEVRQTLIHDDDGTAIAVQGLVLDVTDHKRHADTLQTALRREQQATEELRRLNQLKNAFLQAASHELRTPLTAIYGIASTLHGHRDELGTQEADHLWERLEANVERLRTLLDDLLDINRLTNDQLTAQLDTVDLADIAHTVIQEVSLGHRTMRTDLAPTPATVEPSKIERILHNLLGNVVKHTPEGTTVIVATHPGPDGCAVLVVEDDGPGIDPAIRDNLFEPFVQGPAAATSPQPGTGIGLSLVHQFTELHHGTIQTGTPSNGVGTRFQITFPLQPTDTR